MSTIPEQHENGIVQPANLMGRDEMNLAELPFALLADRVPKGQKTLYFEDRHGRLTVTGSDAYGLPTAVDTDVIVALLYLTKLRNGFSDAKVNFSRYELIKLLGWHDEGGSYKRLDQSFNRWTGVMLVYDKCWWDNKLKKLVSAKMHILESVVISESPLGGRKGQADLPLSSFTWNKTFIESCQADNLRQLNLDTYFSLGSAISKRLYRFLGKRFYLQGDWVFDLHEVAFDRVGLSRGYENNAGKIKEKLQPAIDELEAIGFLKPLSREDRYHRIDRGLWTIRLVREPLPVPALSDASPDEAEPKLPVLVAELVKRGVTAKIAAGMVEQYLPAFLESKIDEFDWEMTQPKPPKRPAGYLVKSINDDYAAPKGFLPKEERDRLAETKRQAVALVAATRRRQIEQDAAEKAERQAINDYRKGLTEEQLARLESDAIAQAAEVSRLALEQTHNMKIKKMLVGSILDEHIRLLLKKQGDPA